MVQFLNFQSLPSVNPQMDADKNMKNKKSVEARAQTKKNGFEPQSLELHAFKKLHNHDSKFDGADLVQWAKRLSDQASDAFKWERKAN